MLDNVRITQFHSSSKYPSQFIANTHLTGPFQRKPLPFPWRQALLSRPFQALIVVQFCQNWGDYLIMTELPTYISTVLNYPLDTVRFDDCITVTL